MSTFLKTLIQQNLGQQLARLKRLHRETAEIIVRIERHVDRIAAR